MSAAMLHLIPEASEGYDSYVRDCAAQAAAAAADLDDVAGADANVGGEGEGEDTYPLPMLFFMFGFWIVMAVSMHGKPCTRARLEHGWRATGRREDPLLDSGSMLRSPCFRGGNCLLPTQDLHSITQVRLLTSVRFVWRHTIPAIPKKRSSKALNSF